MTTINISTKEQFNYRWSSISQINKTKIPRTLWPWLTTPDSLTKKLQQLGNLTIDVLYDSWGKPTQRERRRLNLKPREATWIRTVILKLNGKPVIYARSIIPVNALQGHWRQVKHLKDTPLGGYLFKQKNLRRSKIEVTQLPKQWFPQYNQEIWARQSVFHQFGSGILVSEAFFDDMALFTSPFGVL